jgi:DNA-binding NtrC family response regulator
VKSKFSIIPAISIYAVDDDKDLTDLYTTWLGAAGYHVNAFNERADALASLKTDRDKPQVLITDYRGDPMPIGPFMHHCFTLHPGVRILMASGFNQIDAPFYGVRPVSFLRKPFTSEEFLLEVHATLRAPSGRRFSCVSIEGGIKHEPALIF